ncbi:Mfa1 family fimbria major subunit [Prevotella sp.]|uniref:Mfa1 family fimbria major subunit n=1 Tax=Prevotella sp. TaxID=59823 RepID=UPI004026762C
MKIFKLFPLACAALMMSACSSDDVNGSENPNIASEAQYLAVNIVNVGTTPTRATEDYVNGTDDENKINTIRFYFFHADGSPYVLTNTTETTTGTDVNWLEQNPPITTTPPTPAGQGTVDKVTEAVLVIQGKSAAAPATMVAVINPETLKDNATLNNKGTVTLSELRDSKFDTQFYKLEAGTNKAFVMTNSVYREGGNTICPTLVSGHLETSDLAAKANPVNIYVERVAAKVSAKVDDTTVPTGFTANPWEVGDGTKWATDQYGMEVGTFGKSTKIYAVIEGWGVADENSQAMLEKQIDATWTNTSLGITPWNTADYHRSFWETMKPAVGTDIYNKANHSFNEYTSKIANNFSNITYTLPNTTQTVVSDVYNGNNLTKFLVAATLKYYDGTNWRNADICRYRGIEYMGGEAKLKEVVAATYNKYYTKNTAGEYEPLAASDIKFDYTRSVENTVAKKVADCQMVPTLVDRTKEYYTKTVSSTGTTYTLVTNNDDVVKDIEMYPADIRENGKTYYYVPIRHLGAATTDPAYYGVVRNHYYQINLQSLKGFGSSVYNPDREIKPVIPAEETSYLAAKINVLQWRVVSQDVNLGK